MSDYIDHAKEGIEKAHEAHVEHGDSGARRIAILISVLAASLALAEMQERSAQNEYLTRHVEVSDDYAFYQAKTVRWNLYTLQADTLAAAGNANDPAIPKQIDAWRAEAARLNDDETSHGRKQLLAQAEEHKAERTRFAHRYEAFELVVGALQIAIVLASVSVVTRIRTLAYGAGAIGGLAIVAAVLVAAAVL